MKRIVLSLVLLITINTSFSQNILCKEPGTQFPVVMDFLLSRDYVSLKYVESDRIIATAQNFIITYYFYQENLYQVMLQQRYDKKRNSLNTLEGFSDWFRLIGADVIAVKNEASALHHVVVKGKRISELNWAQLSNGQYEIKFVTADISLSPGAAKRQIKEAEVEVYASLLAER